MPFVEDLYEQLPSVVKKIVNPCALAMTALCETRMTTVSSVIMDMGVMKMKNSRNALLVPKHPARNQ